MIPPENDPPLRLINYSGSRVRPLPRPIRLEVGKRYRRRFKGRCAIVQIQGLREVGKKVKGKARGRKDTKECWLAIDLQTRRMLLIDSVKGMQEMARCPNCHVLHYEKPVRGWPCLACRAEWEAAKAGGE